MPIFSAELSDKAADRGPREYYAHAAVPRRFVVVRFSDLIP